MKKNRPLVLVILDGWGLSPSWGGNATAVNPPKYINRLWREYPHKILQAFSLIAGKYGVVGDSRLGHSTIAAGRRIPQDLEIISESIQNSTFYKNKNLISAIDHAKKNDSNLHLLGLLSNGGVHSHLDHLCALLELCFRQNFDRVYIDVICDGIDSGSSDALSFIEKVKTKILETGIGKFSSCVGRNFAMDRVGDYEKTIKAYDMLARGIARKTDTISRAISLSYKEGQNDFTIEPTLIENDGKVTPINNNDSIIFFNFRHDRSAQLLNMFTDPKIKKMFWDHRLLSNLDIVTFTKTPNENIKFAFEEYQVQGTLNDVLAKYQERQLRIAETEKFAHVTTFFNCGKERPEAYEKWQLIKSRKNENILKNPDMQTPKVAREVAKAIKSGNFDFILTNLANVDLVSHTGNIIAAGRAINSVDQAVRLIVEENKKVNGTTVITADHGNIEQMAKLKPYDDPETKHTLNPVPFIVVSNEKKKNLLQGAISSDYNTLSKLISAKESLADVAPTILELLNLPMPEQMTGHSLLGKLE